MSDHHRAPGRDARSSGPGAGTSSSNNRRGNDRNDRDNPRTLDIGVDLADILNIIRWMGHLNHVQGFSFNVSANESGARLTMTVEAPRDSRPERERSPEPRSRGFGSERHPNLQRQGGQDQQDSQDPALGQRLPLLRLRAQFGVAPAPALPPALPPPPPSPPAPLFESSPAPPSGPLSGPLSAPSSGSPPAQGNAPALLIPGQKRPRGRPVSEKGKKGTSGRPRKYVKSTLAPGGSKRRYEEFVPGDASISSRTTRTAAGDLTSPGQAT